MLMSAFINTTPSIFFMIAQGTWGDHDITVSSLSEGEYLESGNFNYYS